MDMVCVRISCHPVRHGATRQVNSQQRALRNEQPNTWLHNTCLSTLKINNTRCCGRYNRATRFRIHTILCSETSAARVAHPSSSYSSPRTPNGRLARGRSTPPSPRSSTLHPKSPSALSLSLLLLLCASASASASIAAFKLRCGPADAAATPELASGSS